MLRVIISLSFIAIFMLTPVLNASDKIDINKATEDELAQIPTIGLKIAKRIVEYRKTNGRFKSLDELKLIKGIGAKRLEAIKERVTIGEDTENIDSIPEIK